MRTSLIILLVFISSNSFAEQTLLCSNRIEVGSFKNYFGDDIETSEKYRKAQETRHFFVRIDNKIGRIYTGNSIDELDTYQTREISSDLQEALKRQNEWRLKNDYKAIQKEEFLETELEFSFIEYISLGEKSLQRFRTSVDRVDGSYEYGMTSLVWDEDKKYYRTNDSGILQFGVCEKYNKHDATKF